MQVSVEKTGPCEAKISFTVPRDVFDREYQAALKASARGVKMKGFRPGKVPAKILEKEFGPQVQQKAVEHFLNQAYQKAVEENELKPVGHERIPLEQIDLEGGKDLEHSFEVSLAPTFEIAEYKGLEVSNEVEPVLDSEVEEAIADLKLQRSTPEAAGDEGIPEDGLALCKVIWTHDGSVVLDRDGVRLAPLAPPPGVDAEAFKEALLGAKNEETFEIPMTIPEDYTDEELRGKEATCTITVTEAYRMSPPEAEELWKLLETETEEEFLAKARHHLEEVKQAQENGRQETALLEALIAKHDFDVPARMLEQQLEGRKNQLRQQLIQSGTAEAELEDKVAEQDAQLQADTEKAVRALFLINVIAEKEAIAVENEDMVKEVQAIAQRHQAKVDDVVEYYRKNNLIQQMQLELLERKIRVFLRENAKIVEP